MLTVGSLNPTGFVTKGKVEYRELRPRQEVTIEGVPKAEGHNLIGDFVNTARRHGSRPALYVEGEHFSYEALAQACSNIATTILERHRLRDELAAIFAHKSLTAYAGVLGILASGRGYVPLNPKFPIARTRKMLLQSGCSVVVVGQECVSQLEALLSDLPKALTVILPEVSDIGTLASQFGDHQFVPSALLSSGPAVPMVPPTDDAAIAYLLFTSGSTGDPKGVPVGHSNVLSYLEFISKRYGVHCEDRVSQTFDLTFDLSVHDMFVCWKAGACLCCVPEALGMAPARFIRDQQLTMWFSVPSVVSCMSRLRLLRPGLFPSLRCSLFCGEALPEKSVVAWQQSAPNSIIENLYGPTEATIAITFYRWLPSLSPSRCRNGIVPIGWPFDGQRVCIVDSHSRPVSRGETGELLLSGSQVTAGYWRDPEQTRKRYIRLADDEESIWYRTGDCVAELEDGCVVYFGRLDNQVKIRGFRAELQEVDFVLREVTKSDEVVSVAWPVRDGSADGIEAFVACASDRDRTEILNHCRASLPDYMIPREIHFVDELPRSANGKIDRRKLIAWLERSSNE